MATFSIAQQHACVSSASAASFAAKRTVRKSFSGLQVAPLSGRGSPSLQSKLCRGRARLVCAVGDVSPEGTSYLIAGAIAVALIGTAYPVLFARKDLCPQCDGAGFVRKSGSALSANAARKDLAQIVCPTCKGLGKLGQVDK
ncbi:hypothetical protein GOP47_0004582 [Adiantum capillus-veneris]|uniref:Uncharacterized protein n=1 Tax=Adiantum capillus-veneris TaxID=13818 RepID=A0A9D4V737_ADICA|nr:hypothetical protein GOP47_0004031 [Adiantum capillus-veneris]KAI5081399.1 hypothetical protein GOP47_0004582 [Adiantum capillus-veneris]